MLPGCLYEGLPADGAAPLCCKSIQAYVSRRHNHSRQHTGAWVVSSASGCELYGAIH